MTYAFIEAMRTRIDFAVVAEPANFERVRDGFSEVFDALKAQIRNMSAEEFEQGIKDAGDQVSPLFADPMSAMLDAVPLEADAGLQMSAKAIFDDQISMTSAEVKGPFLDQLINLEGYLQCASDSVLLYNEVGFVAAMNIALSTLHDTGDRASYDQIWFALDDLENAVGPDGSIILDSLFIMNNDGFNSVSQSYDLLEQDTRSALTQVVLLILGWAGRGDVSLNADILTSFHAKLNTTALGQRVSKGDDQTVHGIVDAIMEVLQTKPDERFMEENFITAVSMVQGVMNGKTHLQARDLDSFAHNWTSYSGWAAPDFSALVDNDVVLLRVRKQWQLLGVDQLLSERCLRNFDYTFAAVRSYATSGTDTLPDPQDPHPEFAKNSMAAKRYSALLPFKQYLGENYATFQNLGFTQDISGDLSLVAAYEVRIAPAQSAIESVLEHIAQDRKSLIDDLIGDARSDLLRDIDRAVAVANTERLQSFVDIMKPLENPGPQGFQRTLSLGARHWPALAKGAQEWLALSHIVTQPEVWASGLVHAHDLAAQGIETINNAGPILPQFFSQIDTLAMECDASELATRQSLFEDCTDVASLKSLLPAETRDRDFSGIESEPFLQSEVLGFKDSLSDYATDRAAMVNAVLTFDRFLTDVVDHARKTYQEASKFLATPVINVGYNDNDQDGKDDMSQLTPKQFQATVASFQSSAEGQAALDDYDAHKDLALFARLIDWLGEIRFATGGRNRRLVDLFEQDLTPTLGTELGAYVAKSFKNISSFEKGQIDVAEPAPFYLARLSESHLSQNLFGHQIRKREIEMCKAIIDEVAVWQGKVDDAASQRPFLDAAQLRIVEVVIDDFVARCETPDYHSEWPSGLASAYASQHATQHTPPEQTAILTLLSDLQDTWFDKTKPLADVAANFASAHTGTAMGQGIGLLGNAPTQIQEALLERLPALQLQLAPKALKSRGSRGYLESHELDFRLHNDRGAEELSSLVSQDMVLELINSAPRTFKLGDPKGPAGTPLSKPLCHFILRFRPGTLDADLENIGLDGPDPVEGGHWQIVGRKPHSRTQPDYDELFIAGPVGHEIRPGQSRHLILQQMRGADNGTRITRVLMLHQGLMHEQDPMQPGLRERRLTVSNTLPYRDERAAELPLDAQLVSSTEILNDNGLSKNSLKVQLTNVQSLIDRRTVSFCRFHQIAKSEFAQVRPIWQRSRVILAIDTCHEDNDAFRQWALCTQAEATAIDPQLMFPDGTTAWDVAFTSQGNAAEWIFTPPSGLDDARYTLLRGQGLALNVANIASSTASGPSNISIRIENMSGFPDREFTLQVQKGPMVQAPHAVGINTAQPTAELDVHGSINVSDTATVRDVYMPLVPVGAILPYFGLTEPEGYLFCDGSPVPDSIEPDPYKTLRKMLRPKTPDGNVDFSTVVYLPDMRGRLPIGSALRAPAREEITLDGSTPDTNALGANTIGSDPMWPQQVEDYLEPGARGGNWFHELTNEELPDHNHTLKSEGFYTDGSPQPVKELASTYGYKGTYDGVRDHLSIGFTTYTYDQIPGAGHPNMPPYVACTYIIKY